MAKKEEKQENPEVEALKEKLLINRKNGFFSLTDEKVKKADDY